MRSPLAFAFAFDVLLTGLVSQLNALGARLAARAVLQAVRRLYRHRPVRHGTAAANPAEPSGPFTTHGRGQVCDLLIFVPRALDSYLIDEATGAYGYSHVTVDCGEADAATGKPVMIESMVHTVVRRVFQDRYGERPFIRLPLSEAGVDCGAFCDCVRSKLGEAYDYWEALTWGEVDNPAKQTCSDLAAGCLPREVLGNIVQARLALRLRPRSVSVHRHAARPATVWVSPNGLAHYFGAPHGKDVSRPDQLVHPRRRLHLPHWLARLSLSPLGVWALAGLAAWIGWQMFRPRRRLHLGEKISGHEFHEFH